MISHSRRCHRVLAVILRETMIPLLFGLAVSILAAVPLSRLLANLPYGVSSIDCQPAECDES